MAQDLLIENQLNDPSSKRKQKLIEEYLKRGDEFFDSTKYVEAISYYDKIFELYNRENKTEDIDRKLKSVAYFRKGRSFLRLNKLHKSIENFSHAVKCKPDHVFARIMNGFAMHDVQRRQESKEMFETSLKILEVDPSKKIPVFFLQILNEIYFSRKTGKYDMIKLIVEITRNNLFKSNKSEKSHKSH